ncbi:MAG TPA: DUF192 domain-containing protein [Aquabacterium sp.]|uniref:DUF192 domain-containing protein n=1 Tax=Aquabacterium sp. TaxID=1872578 RepID=UPI002E318B92|nr:DUF192 domain-containing protein [Aquabacterium sp.]HEX5372881.1 DUF192 domain-containing protein [Aquabacterium sp.]
MAQIVLQERIARSTSWLKGLALAGLLLGASLPAHAQMGLPTGPQRLPAIQLRAGMHLIKAEVAQTPREQQIGLMNRSSMGVNEGMLFVFPQASKQCFWMKNTLIPLAIAFVADDGSIVNIDEMQPQTENNHCSAKPVRFVLEMNKGWFAKRGIKEGDKLAGEPFSPTP